MEARQARGKFATGQIKIPPNHHVLIEWSPIDQHYQEAPNSSNSGSDSTESNNLANMLVIWWQIGTILCDTSDLQIPMRIEDSMGVPFISHYKWCNSLLMADLGMSITIGTILEKFCEMNDTNLASTNLIMGVETPQGRRITHPQDTILTLKLETPNDRALVMHYESPQPHNHPDNPYKCSTSDDQIMDTDLWLNPQDTNVQDNQPVNICIGNIDATNTNNENRETKKKTSENRRDYDKDGDKDGEDFESLDNKEDDDGDTEMAGAKGAGCSGQPAPAGAAIQGTHTEP